MSTSYQANNPLPPRSGSVVVLTSTTVAAATTVPTAWAGKFVGVVSPGSVRVLFADTSGITATSGIGAASSTNGVSVPIPAGEPQFFRIDGTDTWLHHLAGSTTTIALWLASP